MDDLQSKISSIFSSPESMEQIRALAQSLAGNAEIQAPSPTASIQESTAFPLTDPRIMTMMTRAMNEFSKPSEVSALLGALRPYLSPERQSKIDNAINIAKIAKIAKTIIPEIGGDKGV